MASGVVSMSTLLDSLLQKSYHELTVLAELLPRKSDVDRKTEIVQFARRTRLQLVRLLALVKWAGSSDSVQKCYEMSALVSRQCWLYEDTANQLVALARQQLLQACMPNFSLAPALDVLCTGSYPRLPTCIQDNIIPPSPLAGSEASEGLGLLTNTIRRRLLQETIPQDLQLRSIDRGLVVFEVPHEFSLSLSVVSEDPQLPWRLVRLSVLVGASLPGSPPLVHSRQLAFLTQLVQSHLASIEGGLPEAFHCLHSFCMWLQLDCLHSQALQLSSLAGGGSVRVEDYQPGTSLTLGYWLPTSHGLSDLIAKRTGGPWPKLLITADPSSPHPLTCSHIPPLPAEVSGEEWSVRSEKLCLEELLGVALKARARSRLNALRDSLVGTSWEKRAAMVEEPLCLRVLVPMGMGEGAVVISVERRSGRVKLSVEPRPCWAGVTLAVEEAEKGLVAGVDILPLLNHLQCQLLFDHLFCCTEELGLASETSLPLSSPLPLPLHLTLYIQLLPLSYLAVSVQQEVGGGGGGDLQVQWYLVELASTTFQPGHGLAGSGGAVPQLFLSAMTLVEVSSSSLLQDSLRAIVVKQNPVLLKRKLRDGQHSLPSPKRVCVLGQPDMSPLPTLASYHCILLQVTASLKAAGIQGHQVLSSSHGCPLISVCSFPVQEGENIDLHDCLSSLLLSCLLLPSPIGHKLIMVFSPLISVDLAPKVVLYQDLPLTFDPGQALLASWQSKLTFLSLAMELRHYLQDSSASSSSPVTPLSSCSLTHFGYDSFTVTFGEHSLNVHGGVTGMQLSLSPDCPQAFLVEPLQRHLLSCLSLPMLLKGIVDTEEVCSLLVRFEKQFTGAKLVAVTPTQVQIIYDNLALTLNLLTGGQVEFTDLVYTQQRMSSFPGTPGPIGHLKAFILSFLGVEGPGEIEDAPTPLPRLLSGAGPLQPSPMPIPSPSRPGWPSSPLPSIPQLPTPPSHPTHFTTLPSSWSHATSLEQFRSLVTTPLPSSLSSPSPPPPLHSFLASLAQLFHFWICAATDRVQQQPSSIQFISVDRGTYHFRSDSLTISLSVDMTYCPSLQLALRPTREGCWTAQELQHMTDFFKKEVASPPYSLTNIMSFLRLMYVPPSTLRSCVELMEYHMNPPPSLPWQIALCMTIPPGAGEEIVQLRPGNSGVYYKGKLLLMVQLTNTQSGQKHLIPLVHDIRPNTTFTPRHHAISFPKVEALLKKTSQDCNKPNNTECSLLPAVKALLSQTHLT